MSLEGQPAGGQWEQIPTNETEVDRLVSRLGLDFVYESQQKLRNRVADLLASKAAIADGQGWAIFPMGDNYGSILQKIGLHSEVLVMYEGYPGFIDPDVDLPTIKIVTNEPFLLDDQSMPGWLCQDITVHNRCAWYGLSVSTDDRRPKTRAIIFNTLDDGSLDFYTEDELLLKTPESYRPNQANRTRIYPFGKMRSLDDNLYAIDKAHALIDQIQALTPTYSYNIFEQ